MSKKDKIVNLFRSLYVLYGILFVTILGGLIQILSFSTDLNKKVIFLLEEDPLGVSLNGIYLFPPALFNALIVILSIAILFPMYSIFKIFLGKYEDIAMLEAENKQLLRKVDIISQDLDDAISSAKSITEYLFPEDVYVGRWDIKSSDVLYQIYENGDTVFEGVYAIEPPKQPAHYWYYTIDADNESDGLECLKDLQIEVVDIDHKLLLKFLIISNKEKQKKIAIFFPVVPPRHTKNIRISYRWRGMSRRLSERRNIVFEWRHISSTPKLRSPIKKEWRFDFAFGDLNCEISGKRSPSSKIYSYKTAGATAWVYEDPTADMNSRSSVEFVCL